MNVQQPSSVGRKLLSASALRVGNLVAAAILSLYLMPFIVGHLGDRMYGFWSLAAALIGYYDLLDLGLSSAVSQYLCIALGRKDFAECRAVFNTALRIQSFLGCVALLVTILIAALTPWFCQSATDAHLIRNTVLLLGINAALGFPARVYGGVLAAQLRFDIQSSLSIFGLIARTGLVIWVVSRGGGLQALAMVTLAASLPVMALQVWFAQREAGWALLGPASSERKIKDLFSYSVHSFLAYLADIVRFQIDPLVISALIGVSAVTHYRVAGVFAQYYLQIIIVSVGMLQPVLSRLHGAGNHSAIEKLFFFGTKLSLCISVYVCLAIIGWGKPFIARWMGMRYEDAYLPLVVLSVAVFLDVSQKPSIDLLYATFNHRFYTYLNWAEAILNVTFSLLLARPFGILGVATGTLVGAVVVRLLVQPWWVCKSAGFRYVFYVRFFFRHLFLFGLLMLSAIVIAMWGLRPSYPYLISSAVCATAIYAVGSWFVILDRIDRAQLMGALQDRNSRPPDDVLLPVGIGGACDQ